MSNSDPSYAAILTCPIPYHNREDQATLMTRKDEAPDNSESQAGVPVLGSMLQR